MKYYPLFLDIAGKKCVVIGGGEVAARKVARLLECGADVFVVSPELNAELVTMKADNTVFHIESVYSADCLTGAALVIGATDNEKINAAVCADARKLGIPVNIVDDPEKCDFILPSVVERGDLIMAVSTGGKSPALARHLREELEKKYDRKYEIFLKILGGLRRRMKDADAGKKWFESLMAAGILDLIAAEDWEKVRKMVREITGEEVAIG